MNTMTLEHSDQESTSFNKTMAYRVKHEFYAHEKLVNTDYLDPMFTNAEALFNFIDTEVQRHLSNEHQKWEYVYKSPNRDLSCPTHYAVCIRWFARELEKEYSIEQLPIVLD
ncbi:hypothetical protein LDJ79_17805 [Vibrio tritonius]|uniref:Uncharacterized protein n=1 Tax=Vibrio tritonius TaxID=1435069 RepID=A0ABS7YQM2_9VIBR|nr:hypothetical protein [Vibrio tritonius]MCA2017980.1 hypothetical protein [Vibrio tritonius]